MPPVAGEHDAGRQRRAADQQPRERCSAPRPRIVIVAGAERQRRRARTRRAGRRWRRDAQPRAEREVAGDPAVERAVVAEALPARADLVRQRHAARRRRRDGPSDERAAERRRSRDGRPGYVSSSIVCSAQSAGRGSRAAAPSAHAPTARRRRSRTRRGPGGVMSRSTSIASGRWTGVSACAAPAQRSSERDGQRRLHPMIREPSSYTRAGAMWR